MSRTMEGTGDGREPPTRGGRIRGLRDIRTPCSLRRPAAQRPSEVVRVEVRLGAGSPSRARTGPGKAVERPRAWVFVERPRFSRHQGLLLVDRVEEPEVDIFEDGRALAVLAELRGVAEEEIEVRANGDVLTIETRPGAEGRPRYYREMLLPFPVNGDGIRRSFRNGVLDLRIERPARVSTPRAPVDAAPPALDSPGDGGRG